MKKREIVSKVMAEVRPNASHSTRKASTVTMEIERRFSAHAYELYLDQKDKIERDTGLIGFELVAVYEDGHPEPVKTEIEEAVDEVVTILDDIEYTDDHAEETEGEGDFDDLDFDDLEGDDE